MKILVAVLWLAVLPPIVAQSSGAQMTHPDAMTPMTSASPASGEQLGNVDFATSCAPAQAAAFNRGVALLHDFWYQEAEAQFHQIATADPACSMAYWGEAMAGFQQIWDRADQATRAPGWDALQKAVAHPAKTERERAYIAALSLYYQPDKRVYQTRIEQYSTAMGELAARYPEDIDAGAFYALSILATTAPGDDSLTANRRAMTVLVPLFAKAPDNPGVDHYIIHSCDTPALAHEGLAAADHYGILAASAPHAVHMPGHIYARLGMWQQDIAVDEASVRASQQAEARHQSGAFDQLHADDFLLYAYLQSGQDAKAKQVQQRAAELMTRYDGMDAKMHHGMAGMFPYYRVELPMIYDLELHDWKSLALLAPPPNSSPRTNGMIDWAHGLAYGHLKDAAKAKAALGDLDKQIEAVRKGRNPEDADSTGYKIARGELIAWIAYAEGKRPDALAAMRQAADLQDKVGQGEVDIPAREMLADLLLDFGKPREALVEFDRALALSPNRFNGLYHAGMASELLGEKAKAIHYFAQLVKQSGDASQPVRAELAHARNYEASNQMATR